MADFLERRQQRPQRGVFRDGLGERLLAAVGLGALQVDRQQRVAHQLDLAGIQLEVGAADVFAPLMRLHDPGTVLTVGRAGRAGDVGVDAEVLGGHADGVLAVAANDQIEALHRPRHLDVARCVDSPVAAWVVAHVGGSDDHVGLGAQLGHQLGGLGRRGAELDARDVVGQGHLAGVVGGQTHHRDAPAGDRKYLVRLEQALAIGAVDVGRQHRERGPGPLLGQHRRRLVKLMVADRHRVVADRVHAFEVGLGVLQIALRHAGVDVAAVEQEHLAAAGLDLGADAVDQRFARRHAVLAVAVGPEAAMVVVGVQDRQLQRLARRRAGAGDQAGHDQQPTQAQRGKGCKGGKGEHRGSGNVGQCGAMSMGAARPGHSSAQVTSTQTRPASILTG